MNNIPLLFAILMLQGCTAMVVGTAAGAVTTLAVETAKVPFKVTGAAIDVMTDDEDEQVAE